MDKETKVKFLDPHGFNVNDRLLCVAPRQIPKDSNENVEGSKDSNENVEIIYEMAGEVTIKEFSPSGEYMKVLLVIPPRENITMPCDEERKLLWIPRMSLYAIEKLN